MAGPQGGGGGQESAGAMDFLWAVALIVAVLLIAWFAGKAYIVRGIMQVKLAEVWVIEHFTHSILPIKEALQHYYVSPTDITIQELINLLTLVSGYFNIPIGIALIGLAGYLYFLHPHAKLHNIFTMRKLIEAEKGNWPQITPIASLDLLHTPIDEGEWAMALNPMQFAKKYALLREERRTGTRMRNPSQGIPVTLLEDKANQVFRKQVGAIWQGVERLPIHTQALFGVFAARAMQDRQPAIALLEQIARSSLGGKLDFTGAKELALKHKDDPLIKMITDRHAYVLTCMASMLMLARTDGVLATADFLWLKPLDRPLWYMLNSVGRQTPFIEVAGPFAHWAAERALGRKMTQPMIEQATRALDISIKEIIYIPDDVLLDPLQEKR